MNGLLIQTVEYPILAVLLTKIGSNAWMAPKIALVQALLGFIKSYFSIVTYLYILLFLNIIIFCKTYVFAEGLLWGFVLSSTHAEIEARSNQKASIILPLFLNQHLIIFLLSTEQHTSP